MSDSTIPEVTATIVDESHFNNLKTALCGDLIPRNTSGVPTDKGGDLGTETYPFEQIHITSGHLRMGQIIGWYDYGGTVSKPQGYMECDGRQVTEANYDAEHGAGSWETYIGSSALENKYLPDLDDIYLVGTTGSTQSGGSAITKEGNAGHSADFSHSHGTNFSQQETIGSLTHHKDVGSHSARPGHTHSIAIASTSLVVNHRPRSLSARALMRIV